MNAIMQFFNNTLGAFFNFVHSGVATIFPNKNISYGIAIIVFTIIIRIILLPLNIKQMRSQLKMTDLQPEMQKLQKKYKNDPQKLNTEMMKLYQEEGVNPLGGCLPLLVQLPILWALFYVFKGLNMPHNTGFLWIKDLKQPDPYWILPILSGVGTYLSSAMMMPSDSNDAQTKQTKLMNIVMSLFFVFTSRIFSAALVLYYVFNSVFQVGQSYFMLLEQKKRKLKKLNKQKA